MTSNQNELACLFIREHFGEIVESVLSVLLKRGRQNLSQLQHNLPLKQNVYKVRTSLKVLLQHGMIFFEKHPKGYAEYLADLPRILMILKYPQMILAAKEMYGDDAEVIVEEMLQKGCMTMVQVVSRVTDRLNAAMEAEGEPRVPYSQVQETFRNLVKCQFLERVPRPKTEPSMMISSFERVDRFSIPDVNIAELMSERKRKREADSSPSSLPPNKRRRVAGDHRAADDGVYWRMNHERFDLLFRDRLLAKAVGNRLDEMAAEIFRAMLRLNETTSDAWSETSAMQSSIDIFRELPAELNLDTERFQQHVNLLAEDRFEFVVKASDTAAGSTFVINLRRAISNLAAGHIESFVQERFGAKALRIFRMLRSKGHLEQHKIEEAAMMPAKEAKDICYQMFAENVLTLTEIPRTPDHAPSRTIYLFYLNFDYTARLLLDRSYKAALNLKRRWQNETEQHGRILDKQCKVDGIYAMLQQNGADDEQLREVTEMLSTVEREQLKKVKTYRDKLERSELLLADTMLIVEQYLKMESRYACPKK